MIFLCLGRAQQDYIQGTSTSKSTCILFYFILLCGICKKNILPEAGSTSILLKRRMTLFIIDKQIECISFLFEKMYALFNIMMTVISLLFRLLQYVIFTHLHISEIKAPSQ